jgi:RecA/RadA recombinase
VQSLVAIATLNPVEVQLRVDGRLLSGADSIVRFPNYYLVIARGVRTLYAAYNVHEERDVAVEPSCRAVLAYFRAVANLVSVKDDEGQSILAGQYRYLTRVPDASVLAAYLSRGPTLAESALPGPLIYPFGTNASQKDAVDKVFRSQVTLVQGPPGTGKTQTILNMVANAIRHGQTVAVVSNNNAATKNVADRLKDRDLGFLLASLGKRDNKVAFIEAQSGYPAWATQGARSPEEMKRLDARIASLTGILDRLNRANNDRAILAAQVEKTRAEAELHRQVAGSSPPLKMAAKLDRWTASDLLELLVECEEFGPDARLGVLGWLRYIYRHGVSRLSVRRQLLATGPVAVRSLYFDKYLAELQAQLAAAESFLSENNLHAVQKEMEEVSWDLLRASIADRFLGKAARPIFTERELWSKYASVLNDYPVVLSTTHALKTSLSPDCLYDLIIIDEASQVDVATGVLALSCARRAVIVGDKKQLPNVIDEESRRPLADVWEKHQLPCQAWDYGSHSLLSSAAALWPEAPSVLLREQYRCHPKIVGFFNHKFYDGKLITMTTDRGESDVMQVVFTVPGNHARGRINQRQIDVIRQEVLPALREAGVTDIGVIAPYRAQVAMLRDSLGEGIEVSTVHGFQGREKQAIIISTVDNEIGEFVDDPQLLNVAVSRAQRWLVVVMADKQNNFTSNFGDLVRYIRHNQQVVARSKVRSVFDLLYASYENARRAFLSRRGRHSVWDSESLAEAVVLDVFASPEFSKMCLGCLRHAPLAWLVGGMETLSERERQYVNHPWSHVDLLIYDTVGKRPLVCVEVDGWTFHRPGSLQAVRDEIKNAVFQRAGLPLIRLSTTGSGEAETISRAIRQSIGLAEKC